MPTEAGGVRVGGVQKPWEIDLSVYEDDQELLAGLKRGDQLACTCFMKWYARR
jgi:RNA polymerase sigma-70 factor (ECF subfamily)